MSIENDLLREYVTRTKFQLSLTGLQITALVLYDLHDIDDIPARHIANLLNPTSALRRKGLISTGGGIRLTEAGKHTVGLLRESGIYDDTVKKLAITNGSF